MKVSLIRYSRALLFFSLILFGLMLIGRNYFNQYISVRLPLVILLFTLISFLVYYVLLKSTFQRFAAFSRNFMLITAIKLFLYLAILVVYALLIPADAVNFIVGFFILYIGYSAFEVVWLLRIRSDKA